MNGVAIRPLCTRPKWAAQLADWHYGEWGAQYGDDWSAAAAQAELRDHATREAVPTTWIAERDDRLLGSVSLVLEDAPGLDHLGAPWLASLYVVPEARGTGIGAALVAHAERFASEAGYRSLLLFTFEQADWYQRMGWQRILNMQFHHLPVAVMRRPLAGRA